MYEAAIVNKILIQVLEQKIASANKCKFYFTSPFPQYESCYILYNALGST